MEELNFEQMEVIFGGLTHNQTCLIGGIVTGLALLTLSWGLAAGIAGGALYYGCF